MSQVEILKINKNSAVYSVICNLDLQSSGAVVTSPGFVKSAVSKQTALI